jgi:hypothetical protein
MEERAGATDNRDEQRLQVWRGRDLAADLEQRLPLLRPAPFIVL